MNSVLDTYAFLIHGLVLHYEKISPVKVRFLNFHLYLT